MSVTSARASLRIFPGEATARSVTDRLSITPDDAHEAGDANTRSGRPWAAAQWSIRSTLPDAEPLSAHLEELLDRVEDVSPLLLQLHDEGLTMDWFCFIGRENGQGGPSFKPDLLQRLGALPAVLELDVY